MNQDKKKELTDKMTKTMNILDKKFKGFRTGRASVNLLDLVIIEAYGNKMPLSQIGTISTPNAKTITVHVWNKEMVKTVEKAIAGANLSLNPSSEGQLIRITLPPLSEERREELVKIAHKCGEHTKIALRNVRKDGMDTLKKMEKDNEVSKDEHHDYATEIQKLTNEFISKVDERVKSKKNEILII